MIVGFTLKDSPQTALDRAELRKFLEKHTQINAETIENIVQIGKGINVYSTNITTEDLLRLPIGTDPITLDNGQGIIISLLSQRLEFSLSDGRFISLVPTGYSYISKDKVSELQWAIDKGLILYMGLTYEGIWILSTGFWNDSSAWIDTESWRDK